MEPYLCGSSKAHHELMTNRYKSEDQGSLQTYEVASMKKGGGNAWGLYMYYVHAYIAAGEVNSNKSKRV